MAHGLTSQLSHAVAESKLRPVMNELAYNLESFNPAFTAVLLKVCRQDLHLAPFYPLAVSDGLNQIIWTEVD